MVLPRSSMRHSAPAPGLLRTGSLLPGCASWSADSDDSSLYSTCTATQPLENMTRLAEMKQDRCYTCCHSLIEEQPRKRADTSEYQYHCMLEVGTAFTRLHTSCAGTLGGAMPCPDDTDFSVAPEAINIGCRRQVASPETHAASARRPTESRSAWPLRCRTCVHWQPCSRTPGHLQKNSTII